MKYLRDTAIESNAAFIAITETHLKPDILDSEVNIKGWSLYRTDRGPSKSHGGVAIYLRNDLIGQLVATHSNNMCETLVVKVKTLNLILICVYRPPNSTLGAFEEALEVCQKAINDVTDDDPKVKDVLVVGDFNFPFISWQKKEIYQKEVSRKSEEKQQAEKLTDFAENNFFENYVNTATRGKNILDLVLTNNHLLVNSYSTLVNKKLSDHYLLTIALNISYNVQAEKKKVTNPFTTKVYEYNLTEATERDWERFSAMLESVSRDFEKETKNENADIKLAKVYEYVEKATAVVFRKKEIFEEKTEPNEDEAKVTKNKIPKRIRLLMKRKKKLSSRILSSSSWRKNYKTMVELEKVEEEIDKEYKARRLKEEKKAVGVIKRNPKYFYTYAKKFSKSKSEMGAFEKENGDLTNDAFEKSEILRKQYESVASVPMKEFEVDEGFFEEEETSINSEDMVPLVDVSDSAPFVSDCIDMLSAGAAPGPDGIPAAMIKGAKRVFSNLLSNIMRSTMDFGCIPSILKTAYITPIHKGESRSEPANFRPVSLTSHLVKTFERLIRKQLVSYLERNKLMDDNQHGSRAGRSTLSQLLEHQDEILKELEEGNNVDAVYLDFSKAFDKCDHGILLHKIRKLKIKGKLGRWIQNFLKDRKQAVIVDRIRSEWSKVVSGIPQGSVLGPILFLIYIADIGDSLSTKALVYVDDTKIKQKVNSEEDVECFQKELEKLDEWAKSNNMQFNGKKFQVVRYGQNEELKNNTEYFSGSYEEIIDRFESIRDLGVQLSEDASFNEHIEKVCKKARQKSGWIYRTFYCRSPNFLKQMFKSLVQPHIDYCSQLWMPQEGANMAKIEKVLRDFSKRVPGLRNLCYWERLQSMGMNSMQRRLERYRIIYIWKIMEGFVPNCGLLWSSTDDRRGRLCEVPILKGNKEVQKCRRQSFQMAGPRVWNSLPRNVRNVKNCGIEHFKEALDSFLSKVPDEPKTDGLTPGATDLISGRATNSLEYQCARRREAWDSSDFDFGQGH